MWPSLPRAGALAYGITSAKNTAIAPWRMLFLIEGLPNMALAVAVFYFLPDTPDTARFMTADEVAVAKARSILQSGKEGKARLGSVQGKEIWEALRLPQTWIFPFMYFSCNVSFASLPAFLPTIIKEMGYSSIEAQGLTAPPYLLAFFVCLASTWLADRWQQRGLIITALSLVGGLGFVLLAAAKGVGARYTGVFLACAGAFPAIANILSWVVNNQGTDTKRGVAIAMLNTIGQCGPLLGTNMFPAAEKPYYVKGMAVCAAFMFLNAVLAVTLRTLFVAKIRRLERREQESVAATTAGAHVAQAKRMVEMEGTFGYRYIL